MRKRIKKVLNSMGDALSYAHSGEMLTDEQKVEVLVKHNHVRTHELDAISSSVVMINISDKETLSEEKAVSTNGKMIANHAASH